MGKTAGLTVIGLLLISCTLWGCSGKQAQILDKDGSVIAKVDKSGVQAEESVRAYVQIAAEEAAELIAEQEGCTAEQARKRLYEEEYKVSTALDGQVQSALQTMYEHYGQSELSLGSAVTDLNGHLIAAFSAGSEEENFAAKKTPPYSSFKPLSVYAPSVEKGITSYAGRFMDAPFKQITDESGEKQDWPVNPTGTYRHDYVTAAEAIKQSLNTVAVSCMYELGLENSFAFLRDSFGLTLEFEETRAQELGAEEVFGNVALGYLAVGVSPVQMAGYYQTFARLGAYAEPKAVTAISAADGSNVYTYTPEPVSVMKESTACIMNHMLQGVTRPGGTGDAAGRIRTAVAGKTGTGEEGNWFVGVTPKYSVAIWHGKELESNHAAEMFALAAAAFPAQGAEKFTECETVEEVIFCTESGKKVASGCKKIALGYFEKESPLEKCDQH